MGLVNNSRDRAALVLQSSDNRHRTAVARTVHPAFDSPLWSIMVKRVKDTLKPASVRRFDRSSSAPQGGFATRGSRCKARQRPHPGASTGGVRYFQGIGVFAVRLQPEIQESPSSGHHARRHPAADTTQGVHSTGNAKSGDSPGGPSPLMTTMDTRENGITAGRGHSDRVVRATSVHCAAGCCRRSSRPA